MRLPDINRIDGHIHTFICDNLTVAKMTGMKMRAASTGLRQSPWSLTGFNRMTSSKDRRSNKSGRE
jgi:hypothetical protein